MKEKLPEQLNSYGKFIKYEEGSLYVAECFQGSVTTPYQMATELVRRYNNFESLKSALKELCNAVEWPTPPKNRMDFVKKSRALLASLEGDL